MPRVLIVEDDEATAVALKDGFSYEGFDVSLARDGDAALRQARKQAADLLILDVMLPRMSGLDVLKSLRRQGSTVPVIMLTARGQEIDKVLGLKLGADDYVTKPFSFMELLARAQALLRRSGGFTPQLDRHRFGDIEIDFTQHLAQKNGRALDLSAREFRLLEYFIEHRGRVVTRESLLSAVWGHDSAAYTRTVDMHIAKLRKKIEERPAAPRFIVTVHRLGYKFTG